MSSASSLFSDTPLSLSLSLNVLDSLVPYLHLNGAKNDVNITIPWDSNQMVYIQTNYLSHVFIMSEVAANFKENQKYTERIPKASINIDVKETLR